MQNSVHDTFAQICSLWIPSKGFQKARRWHQPLPRFSQMSDGLLRWPVSWLSHIFETAFSEKKIGINCVQWWWWNWRPAVTQGSKMTLFFNFTTILQFIRGIRIGKFWNNVDSFSQWACLKGLWNNKCKEYYFV